MVNTPRPVYSLRENNIFISYSQGNIEFARRLEQEIRKRGRDPWIDLDKRDLPDDINPEDPNAWPYIEVGIRETDIFVFILSQDSVGSSRNQEEIKLAIDHKKPIFLISEFKFLAAFISRVNGLDIRWRTISENVLTSENSSDVVVHNIADDIVDFHVYIRLMDRAIYWEMKGKSENCLIEKIDLKFIQSWLENYPDSKTQLTQLQADYLKQSQIASKKRQNATFDVFISYSRSDRHDFVEKLVSVLRRARFNVWIDWDNIPVAAPWRDEIKYGVESSHTFLQVLTARSLKSEYCQDELRHALENSKRLIAVVWQKDFDSEDVHDTLRKTNWIYFDSPEIQEEAFLKLLGAINTDFEYVKQHTRLQNRAIEWSAHRKNRDFLLRGVDLLNAEVLVSKTKEELPVTNLQKLYINASKAVEKKTKLFRSALVIGANILVVFFLVLVTLVETIGDIRSLVASLQPYIQQSDRLLLSLKSANEVRKYAFWVSLFEPSLKQASISILQNEIYNHSQLNRLDGHTGRVLKVSFSPDKKLLASAGENGEIFLWKSQKPIGERLAKLQGHDRTSIITSIAFNPDSLTLASADSEGKILIWDIRKPEQPILTDLLDAARKSHDRRIYNITFSPGGNLLASAGEDGTVKLWTWNTASLNPSLKLLSSLPHNSPVYAISFSPLDDRLISGSADGHVRVWSRSNQFSKAVDIFHGTSRVFSVDVSPDGKTFASGSEDGTIKLWHSDGSPIKTDLLGHEGAVRRLVFSANGQFLASGGDDGIARVWKRGKNGWQSTSLTLLQGHQGAIRSILFSSDNRIIATASEDDTIKIWSTENGALLDSLEGHTNEVLDLGLTTRNTPKGPELLLASASRDQQIRLWVINTLLRKLPHNDVVFDVSFSSTGDIIASSSRESIRFWRNDDQNTPLAVAKVNKVGDIRSISFRAGGHPDIAGAERLASSGQDGAIRLWRFRPNGSGYLAELERIWLGGKGEMVTSVKFHPKWRSFLASGRDDGVIQLWQDDGSPGLQSLHQHRGAVTDISFQPNGPLMASASEDGTIVLQPIVKSSATPIVIPAAQDEVLQKAINSLDFHPDGTKLVSGAASGYIRLWRDDGFLIREFASPEAEQHIGGVLSVRFSPDGHLVVSSGRDGTIKIWTLDGELISTLKGHRREVPRVNFAPLRNSDEPSEDITLASASSDYRVLLWSLPKDLAWNNLDNLLNQGCSLTYDYLATHKKESVSREVFYSCNNLFPQTKPIKIELLRYKNRHP